MIKMIIKKSFNILVKLFREFLLLSYIDNNKNAEKC